VLDLQKTCRGVAPVWFDYLRDWDRSLRAGNYPETTRYNYLLAAAQLDRFLLDQADEMDARQASEDPTEVEREHVEEFQAWVVRTRSASTALNKHKGLQQFFKWLVEDEDLERSPMARVKQPKTAQTLIPILGDDDTTKLLATCKGKDFLAVRDEAIIRVAVVHDDRRAPHRVTDPHRQVEAHRGPVRDRGRRRGRADREREYATRA
jgi:integrase/recombinase XerC